MTDELYEQLIQEVLRLKKLPSHENDLFYNRAILDVVAKIKSRWPAGSRARSHKPGESGVRFPDTATK